MSNAASSPSIRVDPLHVDDINALCESERARLGHCDG